MTAREEELRWKLERCVQTMADWREGFHTNESAYEALSALFAADAGERDKVAMELGYATVAAHQAFLLAIAHPGAERHAPDEAYSAYSKLRDAQGVHERRKSHLLALLLSAPSSPTGATNGTH